MSTAREKLGQCFYYRMSDKSNAYFHRDYKCLTDTVSKSFRCISKLPQAIIRTNTMSVLLLDSNLNQLLNKYFRN